MPRSRELTVTTSTPAVAAAPVAACPLLLDTHVWLWLMEGDVALQRSAALVPIEQAALDGRLRVSAISVWEVGMLEAKGRIVLPLDVMHWVECALALPGVCLLPLTPAIAVHSARLPGDFDGDPADRVLVASARQQNALLVTRDAAILAYGAAGLVKTLAA